ARLTKFAKNGSATMHASTRYLAVEPTRATSARHPQTIIPATITTTDQKIAAPVLKSSLSAYRPKAFDSGLAKNQANLENGLSSNATRGDGVKIPLAKSSRTRR